MNKVGRRLPLRVAPPRTRHRLPCRGCFAAGPVSPASTTATIVIRFAGATSRRWCWEGPPRDRTLLAANCSIFTPVSHVSFFPVFWQATKLPCPSNGKPWSIHRIARVAQSADETDDDGLAREDARHIARRRFFLFRRYWELFAPYLTPDLAGNAVKPGCPHERPRSLTALCVVWPWSTSARPGVASVHLPTHFVLVTLMAGVSGFILDGLPLLVPLAWHVGMMRQSGHMPHARTAAGPYRSEASPAWACAYRGRMPCGRGPPSSGYRPR